MAALQTAGSLSRGAPYQPHRCQQGFICRLRLPGSTQYWQRARDQDRLHRNRFFAKWHCSAAPDSPCSTGTSHPAWPATLSYPDSLPPPPHPTQHTHPHTPFTTRTVSSGETEYSVPELITSFTVLKDSSVEAACKPLAVRPRVAVQPSGTTQYSLTCSLRGSALTRGTTRRACKRRGPMGRTAWLARWARDCIVAQDSQNFGESVVLKFDV